MSRTRISVRPAAACRRLQHDEVEVPARGPGPPAVRSERPPAPGCAVTVAESDRGSSLASVKLRFRLQRYHHNVEHVMPKTQAEGLG